jgi:predicted transcriptional regulator
MITAKDLMTADPIVIQTNDDPRSILKIFLTKKITALPVGTQSEIVGMLSEMNLVKILVQNAKDGGNKKIGNYTTFLEPASFVLEDADIAAIVKAMVGSPTRRVLVRNNAHMTTGILSPKDLLRMLAGESGPEKADV